MTRFAKIAAETVYDAELDEAPPEKVPSWKRSLPWILGGLAAGGLGYAAYKGLAPSSESSSWISKAVGAPFAAANESLGGSIPGGLAAGGIHAGHSAIKDYNTYKADKNLSFAEGHERGLKPKVTADAWAEVKGPWAYSKPTYNQNELTEQVGGDNSKLLQPTEMVDAKYTVPPGGTADPLEALKSAYTNPDTGAKTSFSEILKDLNHPDYAKTTPTNIAKAEGLMGGRKIDPKAMASAIKQMEMNSKSFHDNTKSRITSNAMRRGTATGALTLILLAAGNQLWQGSK